MRLSRVRELWYRAPLLVKGLGGIGVRTKGGRRVVVSDVRRELFKRTMCDGFLFVRVVGVREGTAHSLRVEAGQEQNGETFVCVGFEVWCDGIKRAADILKMSVLELDELDGEWYVCRTEVFECARAWNVINELQIKGFFGVEGAVFGLMAFVDTLIEVWAGHEEGDCEYL